jgi:hypothetical protein
MYWAENIFGPISAKSMFQKIVGKGLCGPGKRAKIMQHYQNISAV